MNRRTLSRGRHELVIYPGRVDWLRVLGFGLAGLTLAAVVVGRSA
jgi:hypothetical protein